MCSGWGLLEHFPDVDALIKPTLPEDATQMLEFDRLSSTVLLILTDHDDLTASFG